MRLNLPPILNVLVLTRVGERGIERIKAIAPGRLNLVDGWGEFQEEMATQWPGGIMGRFGGGGSGTRMPAEEREAAVRDAHVAFLTVPFPQTLAARAKNLRWAHFGFAGVSNLKGTPWWGTDFLTTSSRGHTQALPIAESVIGAAFMFAKRLDWAVETTRSGQINGAAYPPMKMVTGKTMGIIGMGGIGSQVAQLAKGVGMRVVATRRSATTRQQHVEGIDELYPASKLAAMLSESDFVAVCAMWTVETEKLVNATAFEAMKPGAYLLNIARGEIIDNAALVQALESGKLAGAYLDVWEDDFGSLPPAELMAAPNIIFSPHVSGRADVSHLFALDVFCANLERLLNGEELENVVDWERGY